LFRQVNKHGKGLIRVGKNGDPAQKKYNRLFTSLPALELFYPAGESPQCRPSNDPHIIVENEGVMARLKLVCGVL
jgi:hypothetical protein